MSEASCRRFLGFEAAVMLNIRLACVADAPLIRELISELAEYERCPGEVRTTEADIARDGFGARPEFRAFVAEWNGVGAGFALFFNYYSTWRGAGLYLEDLFVRPALRRHGIGSALLARVARTACAEKRSFVRWAVLEWNDPAIALYAKLGADFLDDWRTVHLADERLVQLTRNTRIDGA
jgi:GNAT superfamily N-acetyltransferase